jgi:hypothetical protein
MHLGAGWRLRPQTIESLLEALGSFPPGEQILLADTAGVKIFELSQHLLMRVFSFFGFLRYTLEPVEGDFRFYPKGLIFVRTIVVSELGSEFSKTLAEQRPVLLCNNAFRRKRGFPQPPFPGHSVNREDGGVRKATPFFEAFSPLLKKGSLRRGLLREPRRPKKGSYLFRVKLAPRLWRDIMVSHRDTLKDLQLAINSAFGFDNDQLYAFYMDGKAYSRKAYYDSRCGELPYADAAKIAELNLSVNQQFLYLYDFGDDWRFDVQLRAILDVWHKRPPEVVNSAGEGPEQYPCCE